MFKQNFIGRDKEIGWLKDQYKKTSSMVLIYGRRRIGKTELTKQFSKKLPHIYFLAGEKPDIQNMKDLQGKMSFFLKDEIFDKINFDSWEMLFEEFMKRVKEKIIIIIDEFPYLIQHNKSIPSIFQKIWDENLKNKKIMLIILGSSIGMMENYVLGQKSPLYGRRTGQWELKPLKFSELKQFFQVPLDQRLKFFSFTDGIPAYIEKNDPEKSVEINMKENMLKRGSYLYEEAEILLRQELREPTNYFQILQAIAEGYTKYGEICTRTELDKSLVSQYIKNLIKLRIVVKEFPVTQKKESRNSIYRISDNYYKFWFAFVYKNKSLIEEDKQDLLIEIISEKLKQHESFVFEDVCREFLWKLYPIKFNKLGRWWHKDKEIDIVAIDEKNKEIIFGECKWQNNVDAKKISKELMEKSSHVQWNKDKRNEHFIIFAKSFKEKTKETKTLLFDLKDMERVYSETTKAHLEKAFRR